MGSLGSEGLHVDFVCVHSDLPCIYLKTDGYQDRKHYFQRFGGIFSSKQDCFLPSDWRTWYLIEI